MKVRPIVSYHRWPLPTLYSSLFILVLFLAAALRFYCLSCSSLWHDEGNTWALTSRSFAQIAQNAAADIHPPGYYWLLKVWTRLFGADVIGLRSFSAVAGVATVAVVYATGYRIVAAGYRPVLGLPLMAAFLAAINPFQVYYSQEARMYALLLLQSTGLFWALLVMMEEDRRRQTVDGNRHPPSTIRHPPFAPSLYLIAAAAGLWTHYSFPIVLLAAGLAYLWHWLRLPNPLVPQSSYPSAISSPGHLVTQSPNQPVIPPTSHQNGARHKALLRFSVLNALAILIFLPWLPTAIDRVLHWPAGGEPVALGEGLRLALHTLLLGPIRTAPDLAWPWLWVAGFLPLVGLWVLRRAPAGVALGLWLLAPMALMFALGLFSEAFLKFLLIASPAWCLLVAAALQLFTPESRQSQRRFFSLPSHLFASSPLRFSATAFVHLCVFALILLFPAATSIVVLPGYYADVAARDNYAGIARTVAALGNAATDLVILNAPGQQEVWSYYEPPVPVLALPQQRPVDNLAVTEMLAAATAGRSQIFVLFWAVDEADPEHFVERWLDTYAFKGLESWQGNVRFVIYSLPHQLQCRRLEEPVPFGNLALLSELCHLDENWQVAAGENLLLGLRWLPLTETDRRYKVTVQLLDERQQVMAQRDGEPAGGSHPTIDWQPGELIVDNHALFIPPGTPPGRYRLIVALYDGESGERLSVQAASEFSVGVVEVQTGARLPVDIVPMQQRLGARLGPLLLAGYDAYRRDHAHAPQTPLAPGELLHVTLYWQAPDPLPSDWPDDLYFEFVLGDEVVAAPLAGGLYPTGEWPAGALVRGEFDIPYSGGGSTPRLQVSGDQLRLNSIPTQ